MSEAELQACELALTGMTCANCAARIEKTLNALPGVEAVVPGSVTRTSFETCQVNVVPAASPALSVAVSATVHEQAVGGVPVTVPVRTRRTFGAAPQAAPGAAQ